MNRPKYKKLYLKEKSTKDMYINIFNELIRELKSFDLEVIDKEEDNLYRFGKDRIIYIAQDKEHRIQIVLEGEVNESNN